MPKVVLQIEGVQKTLAELNQYDNVYRRQVTKRIKSAGAEIITSARAMLSSYENSKGNGAPLSGMVRGSLVKGREVYWSNKTAKAGLKIKVGRRGGQAHTANIGGKEISFAARSYQLMVAQQTDAAAAIYDHAGAKTHSQFVNNLNVEVSGQPRVIDPAVDKHRDTVQVAVKQIVDEVADILNKKLQVRYGN